MSVIYNSLPVTFSNQTKVDIGGNGIASNTLYCLKTVGNIELLRATFVDVEGQLTIFIKMFAHLQNRHSKTKHRVSFIYVKSIFVQLERTK